MIGVGLIRSQIVRANSLAACSRICSVGAVRPTRAHPAEVSSASVIWVGSMLSMRGIEQIKNDSARACLRVPR